MGDGIELIMGETMGEDSPRDVHSYLAGLQTLMIAYSKAGCEIRQGAPQLEPKGTDSTRVVQCPLDVVMRYYYRVQDRAVKCGSLEWILSRDEADRAVWVDKYRNGADTLGEVIAQVMVMREAMWEVPLQRALHQPKLQVEVKGAGKGSQGQQTRRPENKDWKLGAVSKTLRDGTVLCSAFQQNKCKNANCRDRHQCGVVMKGGRVCGGRHSASVCKAKGKGKGN